MTTLAQLDRKIEAANKRYHDALTAEDAANERYVQTVRKTGFTAGLFAGLIVGIVVGYIM